MQERKKVNLDTRVLYDATVLHVNPLGRQKWVFFFVLLEFCYILGREL